MRKIKKQGTGSYKPTVGEMRERKPNAKIRLFLMERLKTNQKQTNTQCFDQVVPSGTITNQNEGRKKTNTAKRLFLTERYKNQSWAVEFIR